MPSAHTANSPADLGALDMEILARQNDAALAQTKAYEIKFILNTKVILALKPSENPFHWNSIRFGKNEIQDVPNDQRGLYAFIIADQRNFLPPHGYIMYIGIAGRNSDRSLRDRYEDYFKQSEVERRPALKRMIVNWHSMLRFHFAPVDDSVPSAELKAMEKRLITAFLPPCCKYDIEADTMAMKAAFL
ncbi:MAG: hypothetical protein OXF33_03210 [Rhodospirillales bacterium]|nr:hypothetical protein [Rhodospirillales bacterium]